MPGLPGHTQNGLCVASRVYSWLSCGSCDTNLVASYDLTSRHYCERPRFSVAVSAEEATREEPCWVPWGSRQNWAHPSAQGTVPAVIPALRPCSDPCSPGELTPCLFWPPLCTHAVAGDHEDGKLLLLSWEMSIFHYHPQTSIHQSNSLVA